MGCAGSFGFNVLTKQRTADNKSINEPYASRARLNDVIGVAIDLVRSPGWLAI